VRKGVSESDIIKSSLHAVREVWGASEEFADEVLREFKEWEESYQGE
jgi:hypothetical protein